MTVKELVEELTSLGVSFNKKSRKAELLELLLAETKGKGKKSEVKEETAEAVPKPEAKEKQVKKVAPKAKSPEPEKKVQKAKAPKKATVASGYAIIRTGGKQYQVSTGSLVRVEKIAGNVGDTVEIKDVLAVFDGDNTKIGQPTVDGAVVTARIVEQDKAKKVLVFKKKRRKGYRVKRGHRQMFTALEISGISV
ncbi:MAG: 50S ribosomal protein L21 [Deltaproteobacteria bacterium]|nr:MAG: 50S ribosomal protein L21 [Deltaproteobacteria bacterium]